MAINLENAVRLPGGAYLADLDEKDLNVIPFRKYRFDPVPEEEEETADSGWSDIILPILGIGFLIFFGLFGM